MPAETGMSPTEATVPKGCRAPPRRGADDAGPISHGRGDRRALPDKDRVGLERAVAQGMTEAERIYCRLTRNNLAKSSRKV